MSESIWKKFCGWLSTEQSDIQTVDQITATIAEAYFIELRDEYKASSYNRHLAGLRGILDALLIAAGIDANPFRQVKQITKSDVAAETDSKRLLEPHELKIIDNKATGWIRPAVFVGFFTGLRLSDVVCLRWDAIELDTGFFRLTIRKTSKPDTIYAPEAMPFLIEWRKQCAADAEYVFPELASAYLGIGRKRDSSTATKQFQAFLTEDCKFDTKNDAGQTVLGFHSLRVCNATYASRSGATHEDIQARLQHSSGTTTDKYIRESDEEIREKLMQAHIPLAITGEAKPRNGKTHVRIRELVESMNGQNWMKAKAEILEVMK
jgi:integrase